MSKSYMRGLALIFAVVLLAGCSTYQPVKNVWKSTKGLWNTYVSPPATVDYEDKGGVPAQAIALSSSMLGVDRELSKLERAMQNADKPPTQQWLDNFFATFPWLSGFAGVRYDGKILGQQPEDSLKELDFNPLLYEDKKQNSRALRADVQPSPLGPEIMLATPLYDGVDFLGIVVAYFDMRSLMKYSTEPQDIVVLCPGGLLWPGKYDFAATPLAGVDWNKVVAESSAGTCTNDRGSFFYQVRYLGNLPLVFAIAEKGDFPEGNGDITQGFAYFPTEREKMAPPPLPERKPGQDRNFAAIRQDDESAVSEGETVQAPEQIAPEETGSRRADSSNEIQPGSRESVLLKGGRGGASRDVQERQLEGENVPVERVQRPRRPARAPQMIPVELLPEPEPPVQAQPAPRPSPFGPARATPAPAAEDSQQYSRPSPFGPRTQQAAPEAKPSGEGEPLADGETPPAESTSSETAPPTTPASESAEPKTEGNATDAPAAPAQSGTEASKDAGNEAAPADAQQKPATLPGGRPSPFGPR